VARGTGLRRPVISVGNIALGGRGKTPLVAHLARLLVAAGERPAILTRGYKRSKPDDGVVVVSDGTHAIADLDHSGDEPLMLAESLPGVRVLVCDVRAIAAAVAEHALDATVHLLDDGFQHRALARDADLVVIAPADLDGRRVPIGRLREPARAIARADAVIVDAAAEQAARRATEVARLAPGARQFLLRRELGVARALAAGEGAADTVRAAAIAVDRARPVLAVAGIASPERFQASLTAAGWTVARLVAFPDHHRFTPRDAASIVDAARAAGAAAIVTTAKDGVRLRGLGPFAMPVAVLPLEVIVDPADEFRTWLLERLRAARQAPGSEDPGLHRSEDPGLHSKEPVRC
jgi:tetraacyldisaccharide 4'-kinase